MAKKKCAIKQANVRAIRKEPNKSWAVWELVNGYPVVDRSYRGRFILDNLPDFCASRYPLLVLPQGWMPKSLKRKR